MLALHGHATIAVPEKAGGGADGIWDYSGGHIGQRLAGRSFSLGAVRREQGPARSSALYMLARSLGLTALAAIPVWRHSVGILAAATGVMLLVQAVDGLVGIYLKKPFRAAGPFLMASIHGACLALLCLPHG